MRSIERGVGAAPHRVANVLASVPSGVPTKSRYRLRIDLIDPAYYTVADGDGQAMAAREAGLDESLRAQLGGTRSVDEIRKIEAFAAMAYWGAWRTAEPLFLDINCRACPHTGKRSLADTQRVPARHVSSLIPSMRFSITSTPSWRRRGSPRPPGFRNATERNGSSRLARGTVASWMALRSDLVRRHPHGRGRSLRSRSESLRGCGRIALVESLERRFPQP